MKKNITYFLAAVGMVSHLNAQNGDNTEGPALSRIKNIPEEPRLQANGSNKTNTSEAFFIDFSLQVASFFAEQNSTDIASLFNSLPEPVFPDSVATIAVAAGSINTSTHKVGVVIDPASPFFGFTEWNQFVPYTIDSVFIMGSYNMMNNLSVDTLMIEIVWSPVTAADNGIFIATTNGTQSMENILNNSKTANGNPGTVKAPDASKKVIKYPLTYSDSTNKSSAKFIRIPVQSVSIPADNIIGVAYTFIPGSAYVAGDVCYSEVAASPQTINNFSGVYYKSISTPSSPPFTDYNQGGFLSGCQELNKAGRYGISSSSLTNKAFTSRYGRGHRIGVSMTVDFTGMEEISDGGVSLTQNAPNPASGNTFVRYEIKENADVTFDIYDITGKKVMSINEGKKLSGAYSVKFDTENLSNGVYYYTLKTTTASLTKKMIVAR